MTIEQKLFFITVISLFGFAGYARAQQGQPWQWNDGKPPRINYSYTVVLTPAMEKAIKEYNPTFQVYDNALNIDYYAYSGTKISSLQSPSAVFGDFNGDGEIDAALDGHTETHYMMTIVLLSEGEKYRTIEISGSAGIASAKNIKKWEKPNDLELGLHSRGQTVDCWPLDGRDAAVYGKDTLYLKQDAFENIWMGKASALYYWDKNQNKFITYTTAD